MKDTAARLQAGIADAIPSLAMKPGIRTINGHQAVCFANDDTHWPEGERIPYADTDGMLGMMTWLGEWRETYIDAKLDAAEHNLIHHPEENSWPLAASS
ncbi:hypothetical protein SEA_FUZZBUSTER_11 [Microbacterium phage FuzzBuster]|uniref:Uncharacterized protein n=1 Tax=Microbacterium phage FuzzBuster TaxID=2590935 RepID=A0A516KUY3_9CAUD|nr:hypothetical protein SEA_FUZZBUSTER_11 [Microbacterium phage FuzzBuster]